MTDLSVKIAGVTLKNPVIAASGTFGFGREYDRLFDISALGGVSVKGLTLLERQGNPPPRIAETPSGMLNSVGLQNPGIDYFIKNELKQLKNKNMAVIANLAGSTVEEYGIICQKADQSDIDMVELNISCPNVREGGVAFGTSCDTVEKVVSVARKNTSKPLIVKLSPNVTNIAEIALSAESAGADAVSLINTLLGMRIDIRTRKPILRNNVGGLSGPAVFPVALRMVWQVANAVKIPVIGMGGICRWQDAVEMMLAGASAVQVGTAFFQDPLVGIHIIKGLEEYFEQHHLDGVSDLAGKVAPW